MSDNIFILAYAFTKKWEGGLTDHPKDRGGITNYGVSLAFLRDFAKNHRDLYARLPLVNPPDADTIRRLGPDVARDIFRLAFWDQLELGEGIHPINAIVLFDMAVNHGNRGAVKIAQRACNAYIDERCRGQCALGYAHLKVDGKLGPLTRKALSGIAPDLPGYLIEARLKYYQDIVARNKSQLCFLKGWRNRAEDLRSYIGTIRLA